jgi:excisionase family DNA binding protein
MTPLLTVQQCAERLNCHSGLVRRLIAAGKLPASKVGLKEWRIDPADLEAFIRGSRSQAPEPVMADGERLPVVSRRRFA